VNEEDRELLMLFGSVGIRVGEIVTGLFEDSFRSPATSLSSLFNLGLLISSAGVDR
jgi:hypothetical protein